MAAPTGRGKKKGAGKGGSKRASSAAGRSTGKGRARGRGSEIVAVSLFGLALLAALALVPVSVFGNAGIERFPSDNLIGAFGVEVRRVLASFVGVGAPLVPALIGVSGWFLLHRRNRGRVGVGRSRARSPHGWLAFLGGLLIVVPIVAWVATVEDMRSGWLGTTLGTPLVNSFGWLGASVILAIVLVVLSVLALEWNPLRPLGRLAVALLRVVSKESAVAWTKARQRREERRTRQASAKGADVKEDEDGRSGDSVRGGKRGRAGVGDPDVAEQAVEGSTEGLGTVSTNPAAIPVAPAPQRSPKPVPTSEPDATPPAAMPEPVPEPPAMPEPDPALAITPPVDILSEPDHPDRGDMEAELDELGQKLIDKLKTFNVTCRLGKRTTGPTVTQFEVVPSAGVKVARIVNLGADLAMAVRAESMRIVAPIPGKGAVGVEIPNPRARIVGLREIIEAPAFRRAKGTLPLALGRDLRGRPYVSELTRMPHLLIAGQTGSGKSVCLNTIVTSLIYRHSSETLRLLMIDPKMVELSIYAGLPHLRHDVVTDPREAAAVLEWAVMEMERRYSLLKANSVRSIGEFNRKVRNESPLVGPEGDGEDAPYEDGLLPFIVVLVDELADLMMTVQADVERPLTQLAQKARAIGIHLIVATQRPSVNVITGLIKANFPTRLAFRVASKTDSRTILDMNGADALLGNGDMLFLPPGKGDPVRIQGAFIPTGDTERLMEWYGDLVERGIEGGEVASGETDILEEVRSRAPEDAQAEQDDDGEGRDELFRDAAELCISNGSASTSLLQRRLKVGYGRAARIVDQLHDAGVVGPADGARGREVLVGMEGLGTLLGEDR